jgi:DnaK suppressor protein
VLDAAKLERLRAQLSQQRIDLRREIEGYRADPDSDEVSFEGDAGFSDRPHSTEERARVIAVVRALRSNLHDVDRALAKISAGRYGTCERCGDPIGEERLAAIPWALLCIDCKKLTA